MIRNKEEKKATWVEKNKDVRDFYDDNDRFTVTNKERNEYLEMLEDLEPWERKALDRAVKEDKKYYVMNFSNLGGLVMPILLEMTFTDGSKEQLHIPAEIWRRAPKNVSKLLVTEKELASVEIDPRWETADVDVENNHYPRRIIPSRIESYKEEKKELPEYREIMHDIKTEKKDPEKKVKKK